MNDSNVNLTAWGYGLVVLSYLTLVFRFCYLGYWRSSVEKSKPFILAAVGFSVLWGVAGLCAQLFPPFLLSFLAAFLDQCRYAFWFAFLLTFLDAKSRKISAASPVFIIGLTAGLVLLGPALLLVQLFAQNTLGDASKQILLHAMALAVLALVLLEQLFRNATEDARWNIKPLSLGLAGTFLFDLYLYSEAALFGTPNADGLSVRGLVHALMVPMLLLSSMRRNDWISKIRLSPKAAFHSATLLIAGVYLVFISGVGYYVRYFGGSWGGALQLALTVVALVLLIMLALSGAMRARLKVFLGKHFFRYRYDYREEWLKFTRTLSVKNTPQEMGQQVVRALAEMLESPGGALWLRARGTNVFSQLARWNMAPTDVDEQGDSPFCYFMMQSGWVINLEEYRSFKRRYGQLQIPQWLQELPQAWLVVPLLIGDELIGFIVLASARTTIDVNWEVNDLLKTAGQQAAGYLAQMQATEALLEARKFDAFNKMSAFVVHDLKNIVTQLSLMMKNAKRLSGNPEFQQDMLLTVENSLERMRQMMLQLREGATPPGATFGVDLTAIAQRMVNVADARGRVLEFASEEAVAARGHEERLERIMGHVVQNAFDATDVTGRVWLRLDRFAGHARIVVADTGKGMSQEFIRDQLFKPFQSTKQAGMGIGAYESFQYVQELGGKIQVESEPGRGTNVTILLPLFDSNPNTDSPTHNRS